MIVTVSRYLNPAVTVTIMIGFAVQGAHAAETAQSLLANPKRLDVVEAGCKINTFWATPELCQQAAQATRLRFQGRGVPYTPRKIELFPTHPTMTTATPPKGAQNPLTPQRVHAHRSAGANAKPVR